MLKIILFYYWLVEADRSLFAITVLHVARGFGHVDSHEGDKRSPSTRFVPGTVLVLVMMMIRPEKGT